MQLKRLCIPNFRNLREIDIAFETRISPTISATEERQTVPIRSHALIGQNGTGKSNLIEALIMIFRDIDLGKVALYQLSYIRLPVR